MSCSLSLLFILPLDTNATEAFIMNNKIAMKTVRVLGSSFRQSAVNSDANVSADSVQIDSFSYFPRSLSFVQSSANLHLSMCRKARACARPVSSFGCLLHSLPSFSCSVCSLFMFARRREKCNFKVVKCWRNGTERRASDRQEHAIQTNRSVPSNNAKCVFSLSACDSHEMNTEKKKNS